MPLGIASPSHRSRVNTLPQAVLDTAIRHRPRIKTQFLTYQRVVVTQVIMLMPVETAHDLLGPHHFIQGSKAMWMATRRLMRHQNIGT